MPRIPAYGPLQQVAPGVRPGVAQPAPSPGSFGAGAGRLALEVGLRARERDDRTAALASVRNAERALDSFWVKEGAIQQGESMLAWSANAPDTVRGLLRQHTEGLSPRQQAIAAPHLADIEAQWMTRMEARVGTQKAVLDRGSYAADQQQTLDNLAVSMAQPSGGPAVLERALVRIAGRARLFAEDHPGLIGEVPVDVWQRDQIEAQWSEAVSRSITAAVEAGEPQRAAALMARFGGLMLPEERLAQKRALGQSLDKHEIASGIEALAKAAPIIVGGDNEAAAKEAGQPWLSPLQQVAARARRAAEVADERGWDGAKKADFVRAAREGAELELKQAEARQAEVFTRLDTELAEHGDLDRLQRDHPREWAHVTQEQRDSLVQRTKDLDEATAGIRFGMLKKMAYSEPDRFAQRNLAEDHAWLTPSQFDGLVNEQRNLRERQLELLDPGLALNAQVGKVVAALELDETQEYLLHSRAASLIAAEAAEKGRPLVHDERVAVLDRLTLQAWFDAQGRAVDPSGDARMFELTVDDLDIEEVPQSVIDEILVPELVAQGVAVNDDTLRSAYLLWWRQTATATSMGHVPPERQTDPDLAAALASLEQQPAPRRGQGTAAGQQFGEALRQTRNAFGDFLGRALTPVGELLDALTPSGGSFLPDVTIEAQRKARREQAEQRSQAAVGQVRTALAALGRPPTGEDLDAIREKLGWSRATFYAHLKAATTAGPVGDVASRR